MLGKGLVSCISRMYRVASLSVQLPCNHVAMSIPFGPQLHPYLTVIQCAQRTLQVGLVPQEAVLVTVPEEYQPEDVQWLLTRCDGSRNMDELVRLFGTGRNKVMSPTHVTQLLRELERLGVAHLGETKHRPAIPRICVYGKGQLATQLRRLLAFEDVQMVEEREACTRQCTLAVLAGSIVPDPVVVRELMERKQPFLVCTLVDNRGVVGPLVAPGGLARSALQQLAGQLAQVPLATGLPAQVAAQLMRQEGRASHATVLATAAFAVPLIVQRTQLGAAEKVLPYYQRMVVAPDAQLVTLASTG